MDVCFPVFVSGAYTGNYYVKNIPLGGTAGKATFKPAQKALGSGTPSNQVALDAYANQLANDLYAWDNQQLDVVLPGIQNVTISALHGNVLWTYQREQLTTRIQYAPYEWREWPFPTTTTNVITTTSSAGNILDGDFECECESALLTSSSQQQVQVVNQSPGQGLIPDYGGGSNESEYSVNEFIPYNYPQTPGQDISTQYDNPSTTTITSGTTTATSWNGAAFDTNNFYAAGHPTRMTFNTPGKYMVYATMNATAGGTPVFAAAPSMALAKNGGSSITGSQVVALPAQIGCGYTYCANACIEYLASALDYLELSITNGDSHTITLTNMLFGCQKIDKAG
jgi:hypothetical protein